MKLRKITNLTKSMIIMIAASFLVGCSTPSKTPSTTGDTPAQTESSSIQESSTSKSDDASSKEYPIVIQHALGETVIENKPERIATIAWGNQDVALALDIIPVGVSQANYGVADGSELLPWSLDKFKELGVDSPAIFHDTDGLDYEAISDANPDVILASYSGLTQEEYDLLSEIAPVIAYPNFAWQTTWKEQIIFDAKGMGMEAEGEQLVADLEQLITDKTSAYPQFEGKKAGFMYFNPTDLGKFYVYLPSDPRASYLTDLGLSFPESILKLDEEANGFTVEISAENVDQLQDLDIIVTYGDESLLEALQSDPLVGTIPAVKNGSIALIENNTPLAASGTPSALSIPATIDEYLTVLGEAADKVK